MPPRPQTGDRLASYFADLPPITPASYGYTPKLRSQQAAASRSAWRRFLSILPILVVMALVFFPVPGFIWLALHSTWAKRRRPYLALYQLSVFGVLLTLTVVCYFAALWTHAGAPPKKLHIGAQFPLGDDDGQTTAMDEEEAIGMQEIGGGARNDGASESLLLEGANVDRVQSVMAKSSTGGGRYCRKCDCPKPDRTHHCSTCGRCILKMDHHCVWLGTCMGQKNYRSFLLFLTYASLYSLHVAIEAFRTVWAFFSESDAMTEVDFTPVSHLILLVMGFVFTLSIGGFAIYHWWLAICNQTTLESMQTSREPPALALPPSPNVTMSIRWRPNHLLSRSEWRNSQAAHVNIWDLGWRKNLLSLAPSTLHPPGSPRFLLVYILPSPVAADGLSFPTNTRAVERLRERTRVVRLGEDPVARMLREREDEEQDQWRRLPAEGEDEEEGREDIERGRGSGWDTRRRERVS